MAVQCRTTFSDSVEDAEEPHAVVKPRGDVKPRGAGGGGGGRRRRWGGGRYESVGPNAAAIAADLGGWLAQTFGHAAGAQAAR